MNVGDTVALYAETIHDSVLEDPTALQVTVTDGGGTDTTYIYGVDAELVRVGVGQYRLEQYLNLSGVWGWSWEASGAFIALSAGNFDVVGVKNSTVVSIVDVNMMAVQGVSVKAYSVNGDYAGGGITDAAGDVSLMLLDGTYTIEVKKSGWSFPPSENVVVMNPTPPIIIGGVDLNIKTSVSVKTTKLYGTILGVNGEGRSTSQVIVEPVGASLRAFTDTSDTGIEARNVGIVREKLAVHPDPDGYWEIDLLVGATVRVSVPDLGVDVVFRVPGDVTAVNLRDVRPDPGTDTITPQNTP